MRPGRADRSGSSRAECWRNSTSATRLGASPLCRANAPTGGGGIARRKYGPKRRAERGWCLGGTAFRERMLGLLESAGEKLSRKKEVDGVIRQNHGEEEARRLLERVTSYFGLHHSELAELKRNDPRKVAMAQLIRSRTSVPNRWIARELSLGHVSSVSRYSALTNADGEPMKRLAAYLEEAERRN